MNTQRGGICEKKNIMKIIHMCCCFCTTSSLGFKLKTIYCKLRKSSLNFYYHETHNYESKAAHALLIADKNMQTP